MKQFCAYLTIGLFSVFTLPTLAQSASTPLLSLMDQQKFRVVQTEIDKIANYQQQADLVLLKAKAMYSLRQAKPLEKWMEKVLTDHPTHAQLHYIAAMNKFSLAQEANIFSAPGLAKEGLSLLKQAAALDPADLEIQRGLIGFYTSAPSIAGGDTGEAARLITSLASKDPVQGALEQARLLANDEKRQEAQDLIEQQLQSHPNNVDLLTLKAALLSLKDDNNTAFALYQQCAELADNADDKYASLYQLGRLAAAKNQDAAIGIRSLEQYLSFYQDSDNRQLAWAKLRLAQIHFSQQDFAKATQLVQQLRLEKDQQEKFTDELKAFEKQLKKVKTS